MTIDGQNSGTCITIRDSNVNFRIENCTFYNQGGILSKGIVLENVTNGIIKNNTVNECIDGIYLWESNNNIMSDNSVKNNYDGIDLWWSNNNIILDNIARKDQDVYIPSDGISLYGSDNNKISNNTANDNGDSGIDLFDSHNNTISANIANNNDIGIYLDESNNNKIMDNTANNNEGGLGIYPHDGIYLSWSNNNIISNNTANDNDDNGIDLWRSNNNTISDNTANDNSDDGIELINSEDNEIYFNNFIDNTNNVDITGGDENLWNSPEEINYTFKGTNFTSFLGNYWSDYAGIDFNNDGVGDTPYIILGDENDTYPLMENFESYKIILINNNTNPPTMLSQLMSDEATPIPEGGTTDESTVVFKGTVNDPDGDQVRLEIELREIDQPFTGQPTQESVLVPSGIEVTITRYSLINEEYHWRYRAKDSNGATSDWIEYGTVGNIDFTVSENWTFAVITDLHIGRGYDDYKGEGYYLTERLEKVVQEIIDNKDDENIKFLMVLGDISENGKLTELDKANECLSKLNDHDIPYFPIIGNHDVHSEEWPDKWKNFNELFDTQFFTYQFNLLGISSSEYGLDQSKLVNYAFNYSGINFACLDFVKDGAEAKLYDETKNWLKKWLEDDAINSVILFSHHPIVHEEWSIFDLSFEDDDIARLENEISGWEKVKANFAGHIHGWHNPEFVPNLYGHTHWMDANKHYSGPRGIDIITTEALMVASNDPTTENPKGIIRLVNFTSGKMIDYDIIEGDFSALNPYLTAKITGMEPWYYPKKVNITLEAFAFTKLISNDYKALYVIKYDDDTTESKWNDDYREKIKFTREIDISEPFQKIEFEVVLIISGITPDGKSVLENITMRVSIQKKLFFISMCPINISVIDSLGRVVNNSVNQLLGATYIELDVNNDGFLDKVIIITNPDNENYSVQFIGTAQGNYSMVSTVIDQLSITNFTATGIPTSFKEIHQYKINWTALSQGEEGVIVQIDSEGDGIFDYIFASDDELTYDEYMDATKGSQGGDGSPGGGGGGGGGDDDDVSAIPLGNYYLAIIIISIISLIIIKKREFVLKK